MAQATASVTLRKTAAATPFLLLLAAACRPATAPVPAPAPPAAVAKPTLPAIPLVEGPLEPRVAYPQPDHILQSRDSNFIFGSVGNGRATLTINGAPVRVWPNGAFLAYVANPTVASPQYDLVATVGSDTARATVPIRLPEMIPPAPDSLRPLNVVTDTTPTWVVLGDSASVASDTDRVIIGRPGPNSVYRWFLLPGTRAQLTGRYPGFARVRLDSTLQIWVAEEDAKTFALDTVAPRRVTQNGRVRAFPEWVDFILPVGERPPHFVEERERSIELTLYGTRGGTDQINYPTGDSLIRHIEWVQEQSDRVRYSVHLSRAPYGFLVLYEDNALVLRVRRPPAPAAAGASPLAGLTIAVDAGHPPGGARGPTGLTEPEAALMVARQVERLLVERGATPFLTRTGPEPVDLLLRPVLARRAGAHAFVSIHYNAYGDGVNPFLANNGTEVFFYRPHSGPLARGIQARQVDYQPLGDRGFYFRSLAVVRPPWMPAVLAEGGFMMVPEQEYAMRTPEFQERYARAIVDGLEEFFRAIRR